MILNAQTLTVEQTVVGHKAPISVLLDANEDNGLITASNLIKLWDIEDNIREKEYTKSFDQEFIELSREVYMTNDKRCAIKRTINETLGSPLIEEKSYKNY